MTAALTVGLVAGPEPSRAAELEDLPIDSLWVGGHVAATNPTPEAMTSLAMVTAVTRRVRVGTSILLLPLYPPAVVAKQVADLDRVSGGRIILGVGVGGEHPAEFRACQVPVEERGRRTDEAIPLLRKLWSGEQITHDGDFYAMRDVRIHPPPAQPGGPPVVVAGRQEPAMRRAALLGDGWMPYLYSPQRYATSVETIRRLAAAAGRDLTGFGWYAFVFVAIDPDASRARDRLAGMLGRTYRQDMSEMVGHVAAGGTVADVTATLSAYVDAGARHFIFVPVGEPDQVLPALLDDVMPEVRSYAAAVAGRR